LKAYIWTVIFIFALSCFAKAGKLYNGKNDPFDPVSAGIDLLVYIALIAWSTYLLGAKF